MRIAWLPLIALLTLPVVYGQSGSSKPVANTVTTGPTATTPVQDSQAISVLNQALSTAGGAQALGQISDYTGTGNITYDDSATPIQGTVIIKGLITGGYIRIDATLPTGVRSWAVDNGIVSTKTELGEVSSFALPSNVPSSDAFPYATPLFPSSLVFPTLPLGTIVANQGFNITYNGTTQVDGHSVHDIQLHRFFPGTSISVPIPSQSRELFIDTTTLQIVMMRDLLPGNVLQETHFANYQAVNGLLMPFEITEVVGGQQVWSIQLNQISFNSGLQDSAFAL